MGMAEEIPGRNARSAHVPGRGLRASRGPDAIRIGALSCSSLVDGGGGGGLGGRPTSRPSKSGRSVWFWKDDEVIRCIANGNVYVFRCNEAARARHKSAGEQFVANLGRPRFDVVKAIVTHQGHSLRCPRPTTAYSFFGGNTIGVSLFSLFARAGTTLTPAAADLYRLSI
jgi:hypothetical protein